MSKGKKRRMTLPKKREDLDKIVEEVSETHEHEHHHHHHHHVEGLDEILQVYEIFIDSLRANVNSLEAQVRSQRAEIARLYRILAKLVDACFSNNEEAKRRALTEAASILAAAD